MSALVGGAAVVRANPDAVVKAVAANGAAIGCSSAGGLSGGARGLPQ
jgi:hypothetical protein